MPTSYFSASFWVAFVAAFMSEQRLLDIVQFKSTPDSLIY